MRDAAAAGAATRLHFAREKGNARLTSRTPLAPDQKRHGTAKSHARQRAPVPPARRTATRTAENAIPQTGGAAKKPQIPAFRAENGPPDTQPENSERGDHNSPPDEKPQTPDGPKRGDPNSNPALALLNTHPKECIYKCIVYQLSTRSAWAGEKYLQYQKPVLDEKSKIRSPRVSNEQLTKRPETTGGEYHPHREAA